MGVPSSSEAELGQARANRWWVRGRRVGSIERAAGFIGDVGFAVLFPAPRAVVPSLWEAVAGEDEEPFGAGMGTNEQRVWTWKDELPRRGLAWYGAFLAGRGSFLSPELLSALYPGAGEPTDHLALDLSPAAHEIADAIAAEPLPSATLRALIGDRSRYQRAITELQRNLLVTTAGVHESGSGWPAALITLTCHQFDVGGGTDHTFAAARFVDTMLATTPGKLARAYRWPVAQARARLNELVHTDQATFDGTRYLRR
ncbi:hypothetical protein AB0E69_23850 [Kribbella sp. NPDC026611]|uniref:AlkZ-related protein n=1 Tax=Kribbella sp. NPDC026611 TaxID=3154911 RepID=UPI0033E84759